MNFILNLYLCSAVATTCLPPYQYPHIFSDGYYCMIAGNEESSLKLEEIGHLEVNENKLFIKFICTEQVKGEPA